MLVHSTGVVTVDAARRPTSYEAPVRVPAPVSMEAQPIRVLVVEDDDMMRGALVDLLADFGFSVVGDGSDGLEGVQMAERLQPEVVLMDMRMPKLDGIEATRMIKERDHNVQVVILSAYDDAGLRGGSEDAGATCYLVKGCSPTLMSDVLRSAGDITRGLRSRGELKGF
ncbi:MAG: response regulator transcription factor [Actinobacteria bacterium]|nr:response regulator transcription factor [Actinomycetota bacterium]